LFAAKALTIDAGSQVVVVMKFAAVQEGSDSALPFFSLSSS
jgi:hypothetical protein